MERLKSGDPLIFGRAGEEMESLRAARIPFEVVPGITAVLGAAAAAQVPLTDRRLASQLVIATHHHAKNEATPEYNLSADSRTTFTLYMPGNDYEGVAKHIRGCGFPDEAPCLIVSKASTAQQKMCLTNVRDLALVPPLPPPAVMLFGNVTSTDCGSGAGRPRLSLSAVGSCVISFKGPSAAAQFRPEPQHFSAASRPSSTSSTFSAAPPPMGWRISETGAPDGAGSDSR